nr:terminase family protein [Psychrobacter sp. PraFG1]UNK05829.1 hypothetical protein MN210_03320 [Psychrobacter sp. PraFG1]
MTNAVTERPLNQLSNECQNFLDSFSGFNKNDVLLGYQKRWIADDSQIKVGEKSRRIGLTWAEAADNALDASMSRTAGGCDTFYIGSNKEMAREYIDAVAMWAKAYGYAASETQEDVFNDEDKDIQVFVIYFASGFKVKALSSSPKNLRGMQGNVVIDEAAFHDRFAEVLKAAMALTMWGSKVRIISTHNGDDSPFNEYIKDCRSGKSAALCTPLPLKMRVMMACISVFVRYWVNARSLVVSIRLKVNASGYKTCLMTQKARKMLKKSICVPKHGSGNWLTRAMIEKNMDKDTPVISLIKTDDFSLVDEHIRRSEIHDWCEEHLKPLLDGLNPNLKHYVGEDFARSSNLTSVSVGAEQHNLDLEVQFIVELGKMPYKQQEQIIVDYILKQLPNFAGGAFDARGNGGFLAEAAADMFGRWDEKEQTGLIDEVSFSDPWYRNNTPPLKSALEDGTFKKIPKTDRVLADLRAFRVVKGIPKIPTATASEDRQGIKRHADTAISLLLLRHAQFTIEAKVREYGYESVKSDTIYQDDDATEFYGFKRGVL